MNDIDRKLKFLEERHRLLDSEVAEAERRRTTNPVHLSWLKRQKLALRDAIEKLRAEKEKNKPAEE